MGRQKNKLQHCNGAKKRQNQINVQTTNMGPRWNVFDSWLLNEGTKQHHYRTVVNISVSCDNKVCLYRCRWSSKGTRPAEQLPLWFAATTKALHSRGQNPRSPSGGRVAESCRMNISLFQALLAAVTHSNIEHDKCTICEHKITILLFFQS